MRANYLLLGIICMLMAVSCDPKPGTIEMLPVEIDGIYEICLPSNLKPGYDMHGYASLQYYDSRSNFYVMGIEDDKKNLSTIKRRRLKLSGYYDFVQETVFEGLPYHQLISSQKFVTDRGILAQVGDYSVHNSYSGENLELFYRIMAYETETHFFQFVIWMPFEDYCGRIEQINQITYCFSASE